MKRSPQPRQRDTPHLAPQADAGTDAASALMQAARANPLPLDETIARLGAALQRGCNYLAYRQRRRRTVSYNELKEQELEAIASVLAHLERQASTGQS